MLNLATITTVAAGNRLAVRALTVALILFYDALAVSVSQLQ